MSKLLVVDVGNTTTKLGVWEEARVVAARGERTASVRDISQVDDLVASLLEGAGEGETAFPIAICSVVAQATALWLRWAETEGAEILVITGETESPLRNRYRRPEQLGPDRLAAAVGATRRLGAPVIVASLGTATVVDAVSADGRFLGGVIAAGVETGLSALADRTATLPRVGPWGEAPVIGAETEECMRAGGVLGAAAMIEGLAARMREQIGEGASLALTGGYAELIGPHLRTEHQEFPDLVLEGAAAIWEHNRGGG